MQKRSRNSTPIAGDKPTEARRFYEHLGGANVGTMDKLDPAGGSAPNCRYVWANAAALIGAG